MVAFASLVFSLQALGVFGSLKRDSSGEIKGAVTTSDGGGNPMDEWARAIDILAGIPGPKYPLISSDLDEPIADQLLSLGKLEVAAFNLMTTHSNRSVNEMLTLLNEQMSPLETIDGSPFEIKRVAIWYSIIFGEKPHLFKQSETTAANTVQLFLHQNVEIRTNDRGVVYLDLSPTAWDLLVYRSLVRWIRRVPPRFQPGSTRPIRPAKHPNDFRHIPFIVREYIHRVFDKDDPLNFRLKYRITRLDLSSELVDIMFDYYFAIRSLLVMDTAVFEKFFSEEESRRRCGSDEGIQRLADEFNGLFDERNPPTFRLLYTAARVSFWCKNILGWFGGNISEFQKSFVITHGRRVFNGTMHTSMSISSRLVIDNLLTMLRSDATVIPTHINADNVLLAWENRSSKESSVADL